MMSNIETTSVGTVTQLSVDPTESSKNITTMSKVNEKIPTKKKKKWRIFKRLGYEKLNTPITLVSLIGSLLLVIFCIIKQSVWPTVQYCTIMTKDCFLLDWNVDLIFFIIGIVFIIIQFILSISIIICPGAVMEYPVRNKILAFISIFFLLWSFILLLAPIIKPRYF